MAQLWPCLHGGAHTFPWMGFPPPAATRFATLRGGLALDNPLILRDALSYIANYRGSIFVIKFGGDVVARGDFHKIAQDIALMHALGIRLILVHGAAPQIESLARLHNHTTEKVAGLRITDERMMNIVKEASAGVTLDIIATLSAFKQLSGVQLRPVMSNPVRARGKGKVGDIDYQRTGEILRIDAQLLDQQLQAGMIPIIGPCGIDGKGDLYNINADHVALEVATTLRAEKLIFLTNVDGILDADGVRINARSDEDMRQLLNEGKAFTGGMIPKVKSCIEATERGVKRVHVLNGLTDGVLLLEVFSSTGVGTMIYSGRYDNIRQAREADLFHLMRLVRTGVAQGRLKPRSRHELINTINEFYVYEIDGRVVGCMAVPHFPEIKTSEVAALQVDERFKMEGAGTRLVEYAERLAADRGDTYLVALTTQTGKWFEELGFMPATPEQVPPARRSQIRERGSACYIKRLV